MKIGIATDHGGWPLKQKVVEIIESQGHEVIDFGAFEYDPSDDFPDFIIPLAKAVGNREVDRGIGLCGSGVGASIVANKYKNVRASVVTETYSARQGVEHDDMNLICLGGRVIGEALVFELVKAYLDANYEAAERQLRRMKKVSDFEMQNMK